MCWGMNRLGQLGIGKTANMYGPIAVGKGAGAAVQCFDFLKSGCNMRMYFSQLPLHLLSLLATVTHVLSQKAPFQCVGEKMCFIKRARSISATSSSH
jgi:hypothetical protein